MDAANDIVPPNVVCHFVFDGTGPHLRMMVSEEFHNKFVPHMLPHYSPMLNPAEQARICFKAAAKWVLVSTENKMQNKGLH